MKRTQRKATRTGFIVRSTSFEHLKRLPPPSRKRKSFQKKLSKDSYEVTTYRNHTKIITRLRIIATKDEAESLLKKFYKRFEKQKREKDFGGSIQRFDGRIKTVKGGKVWLKKESGVTKSSHLYSIKKTGKRKNREAEFHNKLLQTMEDLEKFDMNLIGESGQTEPWRKRKKKTKKGKKRK